MKVRLQEEGRNDFRNLSEKIRPAFLSPARGFQTAGRDSSLPSTASTTAHAAATSHASAHTTASTSSAAHARTSSTPHAHTSGHLGLLKRLEPPCSEGFKGIANFAGSPAIHLNPGSGQDPESVGTDASGDDGFHTFACHKLSCCHPRPPSSAAMGVFHRFKMFSIRITDNEILTSSKARIDITIDVRHKARYRYLHFHSPPWPFTAFSADDSAIAPVSFTFRAWTIHMKEILAPSA
jgi:hypothetical protein